MRNIRHVYIYHSVSMFFRSRNVCFYLCKSNVENNTETKHHASRTKYFVEFAFKRFSFFPGRFFLFSLFFLFVCFFFFVAFATITSFSGIRRILSSFTCKRLLDTFFGKCSTIRRPFRIMRRRKLSTEYQTKNEIQSHRANTNT